MGGTLSCSPQISCTSSRWEAPLCLLSSATTLSCHSLALAPLRPAEVVFLFLPRPRPVSTWTKRLFKQSSCLPRLYRPLSPPPPPPHHSPFLLSQKLRSKPKSRRSKFHRRLLLLPVEILFPLPLMAVWIWDTRSPSQASVQPQHHKCLQVRNVHSCFGTTIL